MLKITTDTLVFILGLFLELIKTNTESIALLRII